MKENFTIKEKKIGLEKEMKIEMGLQSYRYFLTKKSSDVADEEGSISTSFIAVLCLLQGWQGG